MIVMTEPSRTVSLMSYANEEMQYRMFLFSSNEGRCGQCVEGTCRVLFQDSEAGQYLIFEHGFSFTIGNNADRFAKRVSPSMIGAGSRYLIHPARVKAVSKGGAWVRRYSYTPIVCVYTTK